jgi:regulator of protease activity HflC (stomatin/prohibitin superfamily)
MGELFIVLLFIAIAVIIANIRIVPEAYTMVIERLGAYHATWQTGLHLKFPLIDRVARKVNMKEQVADFPPQPVITKDNVTMRIDTVIFYQIFDPKQYAYGVTNPMVAIENLTTTTLRNIIGEMELDETLTSRDTINTKMRAILDEATDPWGIKINRVELKNIMPPAAIQESMEKQMKAERERRESILIAEGEKKSAILRAEGEKESAILRADAKKIEMLREAEGHAESIRMHKQAEADGIRMLKEAEALGFHTLKKNTELSTAQIVELEKYRAFVAAAHGQATKLIVPSDIQDMSSKVAIASEMLNKK